MKRLVLLAALVAACGGTSMFKLTSENHDNDRAQLAAALGKRQLPEQDAPKNAARKPRVFAVEAGGATKTIVAYDLDGQKVMWNTGADVQSRIWVGGDFIVELEGKELVARDQASGKVRWKKGLGGEFIGATADRERAYAVWRASGKPRWTIAAFDGGSGDQLWAHEADGALGAPVAQGGVLYSPFLTQWLSLIDGKTGAELARLRGLDEQISMIRATSRTAYFGSKQGVFELDARAASGKRESSTYGQVKLPVQLDRTTYGPDLYDVAQAGYTANDRARVLWTSTPSDAAMKFTNDAYAVHYFRYVFGFGVDGELQWAYSQPRTELVASDHTGAAIVGVSTTGDIVALDPRTGAVRAQLSLGTTAPVLGATFDADGWSPQGGGNKVETLAALTAIARDRDARFERVKELAVAALAKLPGGDATTELLGVLADKRAPVKLKDTVAELLVARKDPASLPVLTAQLAVHTDYIAKTEPDALAPVAKAIAGLGGSTLDAGARTAAVAALQSHLDDPTTQSPDLVLVIAAMAAIGGGAERGALTSHLLLYHADDELGSDAAWQKAIASALADKGGPGEREALRQVALDPRTQQGLAAAIKDALAND